MNYQSIFMQNSKFHWDFHKTVQANKNWERASSTFENWASSNRNCDTAKSSLKVPKIFHQIWLGSKPLPDCYEEFKESWLQRHPDYEYRLWDDKTAKALTLINQNIFDGLSNPGAKSDILRYEILYMYGGIYIDTDFECVRRIPERILEKEFAGCIQFAEHPQIGNAILFSSKHSEVMARVINSCSMPIDNDVASIVNCTGPNMLSSTIFRYKDLDNEGILLLPSDYCYPWPSFLRDTSWKPNTFITSASFGIHHWHTNWIRRPSLGFRMLSKLRHWCKRIFK